MSALRFSLVLLLVVVLPASCPAWASSPLDAAHEAFVQGRFREAAERAHGAGSAEGEALAARAELAYGDFVAEGGSRRADFEQAAKSARAAIALDPKNAEGHLYLALALGFLGRMDGSVAAHFAGYAEEARKHIDEALELAPTNPWANALLGGWNLEIVHDGGALGETIYGASSEKGIAAYNYALALDPGNVAIAYQYALQLLAMGGAWERAEARQVLESALRSDPSDAFQRFAQHRAERMKFALEAHDDGALKAILREQLGLAAEPIRPSRSSR